MNVSLKADGIDGVIAKLRRYRNELPNKAMEVAYKIAALGTYDAVISFRGALYAGDNDVELRVDDIPNGYRIVASGSAVLFIEFGTGVLNEGHPMQGWGGTVSHGEYGLKHGADPDGWTYRGVGGNLGVAVDKSGTLFHTYGNPASRSMYDAGKHMHELVEEIAREVFTHG